jgi:uncharacterized damage-inducible protein DinB
MSTRLFFAERLASELPAFERVLAALPADQLHYTPHEKNKPAGDLAWQLAVEMAGLKELFESGDINYDTGETPSHENIVSAFKQSAEAALANVKVLDDERWAGKARFLMGGQVAWETTVEGMAWSFIFDMVHHRGQLSVYLRPMGGKVPSIYGPSADSES